MQTIRKLIKKQDKTLLLTLGVLFFMYILIHDLIGSDLFGKSWWDSYTLQAMAWRNGSMGLGQNYEYLELAYFNGDWYVSFPPFPSVVLFPLTFIFGSDMPSNFIVFALAMLSVVYLDKLMRHFDIAEVPAALFSAFAVVGSNVLWMSTNGGVWFMAQTMCFALCSMALYYAVSGKRILANTLIAFSVGCRPFSLLWYFFFVLYYLIEDLEKPDFKKILKGIATNPLIIASALGIGMNLLSVPLPASVQKSITDLGRIATPLALVVLGAGFQFRRIKGYTRQLLICISGKLVFVPLAL